LKRKTAVGLIFICCWMTYLTAYLCRVNFSSAMQTIVTEKGMTTGQLGIVGAVFYAVYACGQLVNGYIGDRVLPNRFIMLAFTGTMLCNLGMAFANSLPLMLVLWGLNGCFQSMFWSTIIRILSQNVSAEKRAVTSMGISMAMPVAYVVSWSVLGQSLDGESAKWYFLIPAMVCVPLMIAWLLLSKGKVLQVSEERKSKATFGETIRFLLTEKLHWVVLACVLHGLMKEGVAYWLPLLLAQMQGLDNWSPYLLVNILPIANTIGIFASRYLLQNSTENPYRVLIWVFAGIAAVSIALLLNSQGLFLIGMMALISGLCYANNTALMSFIPMQYTEKNMVASIIGVFDFASYVGAAISTYVLGNILGSVGFGPLPVIWLCASAAALLISLCVSRQRAKA